MTWITDLLWLVTCSYAVFTLYLWRTWNRIGETSVKPLPAGTGILASVVIPVRNEEGGIIALLEDLDRQTLDKQHFEVFVVDDASSDGTADLVRGFRDNTSIQLHLIELPEEERIASPKKRAIRTAVGHARGELIVTTDGDCRVGENWLSAIAGCRRETGAQCISGPVTFTKEAALTDYMQTVEFSSLVGSGACAIERGYPNMCNGANFAYTREAYFRVGGFEGVDHIASGDDEFLLHKIAEAYPGGVRFLKNPEAIVRTGAHKTWQGFYRQRRRWASKWKEYKSSSPKVVGAYVFLCNFALLLSGLLFLSGYLPGYTFLALLLLKILPEWLFIGSVLRFLKKERSLLYIPPVQAVYPFYVVFFGLAGQGATYKWKGRELR